MGESTPTSHSTASQYPDSSLTMLLADSFRPYVSDRHSHALSQIRLETLIDPAIPEGAYAYFKWDRKDT